MWGEASIQSPAFILLFTTDDPHSVHFQECLEETHTKPWMMQHAIAQSRKLKEVRGPKQEISQFHAPQTMTWELQDNAGHEQWYLLT